MRRALAAAATALTLAGDPATAATLVDTGVVLPFTVGISVIAGQFVAARFELPYAARVTGVEGYLVQGGPDEDLTFAIREDLGLPGLVLFEAADVASDAEGWQGPHGLAWDLPAGAYWLSFEVRDRQGFDGAIGLPAAGLPTAIGWPPITPFRPAFFDGAALRVFGEAVPEPGAWALMILGFGISGAALRRRRPLLGS